jgi:hypothetical protein
MVVAVEIVKKRFQDVTDSERSTGVGFQGITALALISRKIGRPIRYVNINLPPVLAEKIIRAFVKFSYKVLVMV